MNDINRNFIMSMYFQQPKFFEEEDTAHLKSHMNSMIKFSVVGFAIATLVNVKSGMDIWTDKQIYLTCGHFGIGIFSYKNLASVLLLIFPWNLK